MVLRNVITPQGLEPFQFSTKFGTLSRFNTGGNEKRLFQALEATFDAKYYAVGFTPEDFGRQSGIDDSRTGDEWVFAVSLTIILRPFSI